MATHTTSDAGGSWWDHAPDPSSLPDWWDRLGQSEHREPPPVQQHVPQLRQRLLPGETFWDRVARRRAANRRQDRPPQPWLEDPPPAARPPKPPARPLSRRAQEVRQLFPFPSRKPGGRARAGQRSGDRVVPVPTVPVMPDVVLGAFLRRWRGKHEVTLPWRLRGLATLAVALSVPAGTTAEALCGMLPAEVLALRMPRCAWRWVLRWLRARRQVLGESSDHEPWLTFYGSRGMPRMVGWAACRTLDRAGLPGWRLGALLRSSWLPHQHLVPFQESGQRFGLCSADAFAARPRPA